jgi:hypothetical protein
MAICCPDFACASIRATLAEELGAGAAAARRAGRGLSLGDQALPKGGHGGGDEVRPVARMEHSGMRDCLSQIALQFFQASWRRPFCARSSDGRRGRGGERLKPEWKRGAIRAIMGHIQRRASSLLCST